MIITRYLEFGVESGEIIDITDRVALEVRSSGVRSGIAVVFVPGATGAVTTIEHEPGLLKDMAEALERLAPSDAEYHHDRRWGDGNGRSHIRASILGPSLAVPFAAGELMLGTWQQIVFMEMDNRPRERKIIIQIIGE